MESIKEKIYNIDLNDSSEIVEFYSENRLYFDNYEKITDEESLEDITLILIKYCDIIEKKNYYSEAAIILEHIFILLSKLQDKSNKYDAYYERALYFEGVVLGRQKRYSESNERFNKLIRIDPKNENYREWLETNEENIFNKMLYFISLMILPFLLFNIFVGERLFGKINIYVTMTLFTLLTGIVFLQHYYSKIIKKRRN